MEKLWTNISKSVRNNFWMTITLLLQNKRLKPNFIIKALGSIKIQIKFTIQYKTSWIFVIKTLKLIITKILFGWTPTKNQGYLSKAIKIMLTKKNTQARLLFSCVFLLKVSIIIIIMIANSIISQKLKTSIYFNKYYIIVYNSRIWLILSNIWIVHVIIHDSLKE